MPATEPLTDDAWVVRGGLMEILPMRVAIDACKARYGYYGLSFFGENDMTIEEIALAVGPERLKNARIRATAAGDLRALDYELERTGLWPHLTLRFEVSPTDSDLEAIEGLFGPDMANPCSGTN